MEHTLNVESFREQYPEFGDVTDDRLAVYWKWATFRVLKYDNWLLSGDKLQYVLEVMTAHITYLQNERLKAAAGDEQVDTSAGVTTSASEGSVSISKTLPNIEGALDTWLLKTPYGEDLLALLESIVGVGVYFGGKPETSAIRDFRGRF